MKIQPLAATFDNICTQYFSNRENTIINKEIFSKLKNTIEQKIEEFDISEELGLKISNLEKKALKARNSSVHGSLNSEKINDSILLTKCYYTLINRLLLRLLNIPLYIDYTHPAGLPTKIEEAQYCWMENRKQNDGAIKQ